MLVLPLANPSLFWFPISQGEVHRNIQTTDGVSQSKAIWGLPEETFKYYFFLNRSQAPYTFLIIFYLQFNVPIICVLPKTLRSFKLKGI